MQTLSLLDSASRRGLLELSDDELLAWLTARGQPRMRSRQLRGWIVARRATSFDEMTDVPRTLRQELAAEFMPLASTVERHLVASDGTQKLLLRLRDGQRVECVLMQEADRRTVCVSTQVGCGMGCVFCASGLDGLLRNLIAVEIVEQLLHARNALPETERLTHIVVMGMGEPLANLGNLLAALAVAASPQGLGLSARHVTVSTVGLPEKMHKFADLNLRYHLAVSLHAPNDALRNRIVPTNNRTGIGAILEAADYFQKQTGRQVTYEYVLLRDVNDRREHAVELAGLLRGRGAHINLIPFNDVPGLPYRRLSEEALRDFVGVLRAAGLSVKARKRKGADIEAACGQLRRQAVGTAPAPKPTATAGVS